MQTTRIELGDGDYALAYNDFMHSTAREMMRLIRQTLGDAETLKLQKEYLAAADETARKAILSNAQIEGADVVTLCNQLKELVIDGQQQPLTAETINTCFSEIKYQTLLAEVEKLYSQPPLVKTN